MVGRIPVMDVMPVVALGRPPAKATVGEPFPVRATVFREGHDQLAAEVVLTAPAGSRRPPARMNRHDSFPDRYDAWVPPDVGGAWTFEVHAWSDPIATWEHDAGLKMPAGVDVDLMFEEGRVLCEKVLAEVAPASAEGKLLQGAIDAAGDPGRPPAARLAVLQDPALVAGMPAHPPRALGTIEGPPP